MTRTIIPCVFALLVVVLPAAAQPRLSNGEVRPTAVSGSFVRAAIERHGAGGSRMGRLRGAVDSPASTRCAAGTVDQRRLLRGLPPRDRRLHEHHHHSPAEAGPIPLEGSQQVFVLYRVERGQVDKIRMFSEDCPLDGGGLTLHWFTGVRPADSVAVLASFITATEGRNRRRFSTLCAGDASGARSPRSPDCRGARRRDNTDSRTGAVLARAARGREGGRRDLRGHRERSRDRCETPRGVRPESAAEGRRRADAHPPRAHAIRTPWCGNRRCSGSASPKTRAR